MALLITTCERDTIEFSDSNSTPQAETKGFVIKSVTINEVKENALIKESLDVIDSQFDFNKTIKSNPSKKQGKQTTSALADPIKSKDNRFTILTDEILEVSTDTTKVYTFRIETPTDTLSKFENFVIHKWSNNKIEYYIYKYNYLDKNQSFLRFTRERVNSDQINTGDFNDYTMGVMYYDPGSDCWISVTSSGGMTYIDASDCGVSAGSGGMSGSGGGAGNNNWYGQWAIVGVTWSNDCIISRAILDAYGNPTFTQNGSPRSQSAVVNCPEGGMNPLNPGQNQSNPWGNSTNPPNIDPLHWDPSNSGGGGGGGGGPSSSSTDGNNQEGTVIAVLPPTRLERETDAFFENLTDAQKDCINPGFGQPYNSLKKDITAYFENNKVVGIGYDGPLINPQATAFATAAIEAVCDDGEVDFDDNIIYDNSLNNLPCQKLVIEEATGTCSPLTQLILDIFEANDDTNLIFKSSSTLSNVNANTSSTSSYNATTHTCDITITFRESYLQTATDLAIARTAIHESLHATLVYMFEENLLQSANGAPMGGFEDFVEAYINHLSGLPVNLNKAHHELMADFIEDIASSLSVYGASNEHSNSFNFYKKLSWSGDILKTPTYQSLYPEYLNPLDATTNPSNVNPAHLDIVNTNAAEENDATYDYAHPNGTTYTHSPKGTAPNVTEPCN